MALRFLHGPVSAPFVERSLQPFVDRSELVPFGADPASGLALTAGYADNWQSFSSHWPDAWQPDVLVLNLAYAAIPPWLWDSPIPIVGLAADWNWQWHYYRQVLPLCERVLTDSLGVDVMHREGIAQAQAACLFGLGSDCLDVEDSDAPRDVDVLFVGNVHPAVQRRRLPWIGRLASLRRRWNVQIACGIFGDDYLRLLRRARIVFNDSARGEANKRVFETLACGAMLFQEASNREVPALLTDGKECALYRPENLEVLLEHYLAHEDERKKIADAGHRRAAEFSFDQLFGRTLEQIEGELPGLRERTCHRPRLSGTAQLWARSWQLLGAREGDDPMLVADLSHSVETTGDAESANRLGCVRSVNLLRGDAVTAEHAKRAAHTFRDAVKADPSNVVAALNLVEALIGIEQDALAIEGALRALATLEQQTDLAEAVLESPHFPPVFDFFRVEWDRAAWENAGDRGAEVEAKRILLRWRLHDLLANLTDALPHFHEAALARPDLSSSRNALGCALAREGEMILAVDHLRQAVRGNPLDRVAARALYQVLRDTGQELAARRFAQQRRWLSESAPALVPFEEWLREAPPVGDELATIVILCCNKLEITRQCLDSVLRCTRTPYELILVDNGSTDGTGEYLEQMQRRPEPERTVILRNDHNVGYPKGCNQALAQAQGRYLVLLNNDVIVTAGWLDGLIRWSLFQWPKVGLVGPKTNGAPPPQLVDEQYPGVDLLESFAEKWCSDHQGQALQVERLTGFCMLIRREVLDAIGPLDEQFGIGFFEDDDLCFRAADAGFALMVAQDVFVHHFGNQTFQALGIDVQRLLHEGFARFRHKWGTQRTAGYRLPAAEPRMRKPATSTPVRKRSAEELWPNVSGKTVSLCMIVKNEEHNLADCLNSVKDLVDEMIVVDTGSEDRTKEIASEHGAKVFDFKWVDSFAAARNASLEQATCDWIFWMDADDRLNEENRQRLRKLLASLGNDNACYNVKCECLPDPISKTTTVVDHVRLFRSHPEIRWQYRVHEQILPAIRKLDGMVRFSDVVVHHTGYQDPALRRRKLDRDLRLLEIDRQAHPDEPFILFNLGSILLELRRSQEALDPLRRSLQLSHPQDSIVRKLHAMITGALSALGQKPDALAACRQGLSQYPGDVELLYKEGKLLRELGHHPEAETVLQRLLSMPAEADHFASVDTGIRGYKGRHQLALVYRDQQRWREAEQQWQHAVGDQPDFLIGWLGLGESALEQDDEASLEAVAEQLEELPEGRVEADVLRVRWLLKQREFQAARQLAEQAIAKSPQQVGPREVLTHVLLQENVDLQGAERALRDVLRIDPHHREALHNLSVLERNREGSMAAALALPGHADLPTVIVPPAEEKGQ